MSKLSNQLIDDISVIALACREVFWEVADLAEDVRSQLRRRRSVFRMVVRQQSLHEQLGRAAHALLSDGVSIERTPEFNHVLAELHRLAPRHPHRTLGTRSPQIPLRPSVSTRRLTRALQSGDWRAHTINIEASSTWIGKALDGNQPAGLCVAVQRNHTMFPFSAEWTFQHADLLLVLTPVSHLALWDTWMAKGSTGLVDDL